MAKVQIKSEKITPFGGISHVREHFSRFVGPVIDNVQGLRCTSFGYQAKNHKIENNICIKAPVMLDGVRGSWA